jgi:hypothetical protein
MLKFANEEAATYLLALLPHILGAPHQPRQDRQSTLEPDLRTFLQKLCITFSSPSSYLRLSKSSFTPGSSLARPMYLQKSPDQNAKRCLVGDGSAYLYPLVPGTSRPSSSNMVTFLR